MLLCLHLTTIPSQMITHFTNAVIMANFRSDKLPALLLSVFFGLAIKLNRPEHARYVDVAVGVVLRAANDGDNVTS